MATEYLPEGSSANQLSYLYILFLNWDFFENFCCLVVFLVTRPVAELHWSHLKGLVGLAKFQA
jgi:hypothetical protein